MWYPKPVEFIKKKTKKEDLLNTESTLKVENACEVENSTPAEVFSKSSELEEKKSNSYEENECESSSGISSPCFHGCGLTCNIFSQFKSTI